MSSTKTKRSAKQQFPAFQKKLKHLLLFLALCSGFFAQAQFTTVTALDPTQAGGFELGSTFAANGWQTVTNGGGHDFLIGNAMGVQGGSNAAYIPAFTSLGTAVITHFYRDVVIPANAGQVLLSYYMKYPSFDADPTYDYQYVTVTNTSTLPSTATLPVPSLGFNMVLINTLNAYNGYTLFTYAISGAVAGSTVRVVFSHMDDGVSPAAVVAFDNISLTYTVPTACSRVFAIPSSAASTFTVPAGVSSIAVSMEGGSGGSSSRGVLGGFAGSVVCTLAVTPASVMNVYVGGAGTFGQVSATATGGIGGANGGNGGSGSTASGGAGGGSSEIRLNGTALTDRIVVAAGGGGGNQGTTTSSNVGGNGGNPGASGNSTNAARRGGGGTLLAGGVAGTGSTANGTAGTASAGGNGGNGGAYSGGGGGGGVFGGGGGGGGSTTAGNSGSGGGGCNFVTGTATGVTNGTSTSRGNGYVYITILSTPTVYAMGPGGTSCADPGVEVTLTNSQAGVVYQLKRDGVATGSPVTSPGGALSFGFQSTPGTYTVDAYFVGFSSCTTPMSGSSVVNITSPSVQTITATGNGTYCVGSSGSVISVPNSVASATYTLGRSGTVVETLTGNGGTLNFNAVTTAGTYTVSSSNIASPACPVAMAGSITVASIAFPTVQNITGGGPYCPTSAGSIISLGASQSNVNYTLGRTTGGATTTAAGTGSSLNFAPQTIDGTYTVTASYIAPLPACPVQMSGTASVTSLPAPIFLGLTTAQTVCPLTNATYGYTNTLNSGDQYTLTWSPTGIMTDVTTPTALPGSGTGFVIPVPAAASNKSLTGTLKLINSTTGCYLNYSITLDVNPGPTDLTILPNTSSSVCLGSGVDFTADAVHPIPAIIVSQNFNSGLTGQVGGTWSIENIAGNATSYFQIRNSPGYSSTWVSPVPGDGSPFIEAASDALSDVTSTRVISPAFSTVGRTSVTLSYNQYYLTFSDIAAVVEYSTDGSTWNTVYDQASLGSDENFTWTPGSPNVTVSLPPGALNQPTVYLRWRYEADWQYVWAVDNIVVEGSATPMTYTWSGISGATGLSCTNCTNPTITPAVTGNSIYSLTVTYGSCTVTSGVTVFATNTAPTAPVFGAASSKCDEITMNWLGGSGATTFELTVSTAPGITGGVIFGPTFVGNVLSYTLPGLSGNTPYYYRVRGSNPCGGFGPNSVIGSVTTTPVPSITPGATLLCPGSTTTMIGAPSGGTWVSNATGVATVSGSGVITGVAQGSATISYNAGGCTATSTQNVSGPTAPPAFSITPSSPSVCFPGTAQLLTALTTPTLLATAQQSSGTISIALPVDDVTGSSTLNIAGIPAGAVITRVAVNFNTTGLDGNADYAWQSDYSWVLTGPNGNRISLLNNPDGNYYGADVETDFTNVTFASDATTPVGTSDLSNGTWAAQLFTGEPYVLPGTYQANVDSWSDIWGTGNGSWTLMGLSYYSSIARLSDWSISISYTIPVSVTWSPLPGLYTDAGATTSYASGSTATVYALPAANSTYVATATAGACATTQSVTVNSNPVPNVSSFSTAGVNTCIGGTTAVTITSSSLVSGKVYTVNYTLSGANTGSASASMTYGSGSGSFTTGTLAAAGTTSVTITSIAETATTCSSNLSSGNVAAFVVKAVPVAIAGPNTLCFGAGTTTGTLTNASVLGTWSSSNNSVATIVTATGAVTATGQGITNITYDNGCGTPAVMSMTVNATPAAITGNAQMCESGSGITLANTATNGTWSSATPGVATVDVNTGAVTPALQGTTVISYSNGCGAAAQATATVNAAPAAIGNNNQLCTGGAATTLTNSSTNGTWSGGTAGVATVNATTGVLTSGANQGTTSISYSNGCGSPATTTATVNATPAVITNNNQVCEGGAINTLANASTNGTWTSSNLTVASIDAATGMLTSGIQGTTTITYSNGCGTAALATATVNGVPAAIGGNNQLCTGGATTTLTNAATNGTWSGGSAGIATVDAMSGLLTSGSVQGTTTVSYANGCGSAAEATVTVNATPAAIGGSGQLCSGGATLTLTNSSTNGTWSGGTTAVALVNSTTGVVTSNAQGIASFTYSNGCGTAAVTTVTVNNAPAAITGSLSACTYGLTATLANASTNGTWSSSNPAIASIDPMTGVVTTGAVSGFPVITYDNGCGTAAQATFTVLSGPVIQTFTGGGGYCVGGTGVSIGLTLTEPGVNYQLFQGATPVSPIVTGTGPAITFGTTYLNPGYYYAVATYVSTGCVSTMPGVTVHVNQLPDVFDVTGGGSYCSSGGAGVAVGLSNSEIDIDYQLYDASSALVATESGTGGAISFGLQPAGVYTAKAVNPATGCEIDMNGSATVDFYPSPTVHNVLGGGTYCLGGSGVNVSLDGSDLGIDYQLIYGGFIPIGGAVDGTGTGLDMGDHFLPGDYTVVARDTTTGCTDTMAGNAQINFSLPPFFYFVGGGGGYCAGEPGSTVTLSGSQLGVRYQVYRNDTAMGTPVDGTGGGMSFGPYTDTGTYTIVATDTTTGCTSNMLFSAPITVNPVVIPTVSLNTGVGTDNRVCYGNPITFTAVTTNGGATPAYEWMINNITVPGTDIYTYTPVDGDIVWVRMTSSTACAIPSQAMDTMYVDVDTMATPSVFITVDPITSVPTGTTVTFTAHVTNGGPAPAFQWFKNGTLIAGANTSVYSTNSLVNKDSIMVVVTTSGGCGGMVTVNGVRVTVYGVGVPTTNVKVSDVRLVPNPNKGTFSITGTLSTTEDAEVSLDIVNMLGQSVYKGKVTAKNGQINEQIQLTNNLANGMYMLNMIAGEDHKVFHFVLEQ